MNPLMRFFNQHLVPSHLQFIAQPIWEIANQLQVSTPPGPLQDAALMKLLEARDAAIRAYQ